MKLEVAVRSSGPELQLPASGFEFFLQLYEVALICSTAARSQPWPSLGYTTILENLLL